MKINKAIIETIRMSTKYRQKMAYELGISERTLARYLKNPKDGKLTNPAAVKIIAELLTIKESNILVETDSSEE